MYILVSLCFWLVSLEGWSDVLRERERDMYFLCAYVHVATCTCDMPWELISDMSRCVCAQVWERERVMMMILTETFQPQDFLYRYERERERKRD